MSATDDVVEIQQLLARYNRAADSGDGAGFAATFTVDGELVTPDRTSMGRDALIELGATVHTAVPGIRHWVNNHVVVVDGNDAAATAYVIVLITTPGGAPSIVASGRYQDRLTREADGWRFRRREFIPD
ncbi:MAG: nuclear transport factor 2 family protein [Ilumatobacteraceae bacterium]